MKTKKASISVVVPSHNDELHIKECLDSIYQQTLRPLEIVVCDDGSKDSTCEIVKHWKQEYPDLPVRLVSHRTNVGISKNFNFGILTASGEYVSLVAADDLWMPEKLACEYDALIKSEAAWAYSTVVVQQEKDGRVIKQVPFHGSKEARSGDIFEDILQRKISPRSFLVSRKVLLDLDLFDESIGMYEDWDLKLRLSKQFSCEYVNSENVIYRQHENGAHRAPMYRHLAELSKVLRKTRSYLTDDQSKLIPDMIQRCWPIASMHTERDQAAHRTLLASLDLPYVPATIEADGEGMVFLISLPRSGSTLLQRVLSGHPDLHSTAEPWVMLHPLYALKSKGVTAEYDSTMCKKALDDFVDCLPGGNQDYYDGVRQLGYTLYSRVVRESGKSRFLDKTPRYFHILPELMEAFPKAKVILLTRNPVAVLSSVLSTWFDKNIASYEQSTHLKDMQDGPALLAGAIRSYGDRVLVTRYEDFVENSDKELHRICEYLGLPYLSSMLEYGENPAPRGGFGDPDQINKHTGPVNEHAHKWKDTLDSSDLLHYANNYINNLGRDVIEQLGYSFEELHNILSPGSAAMKNLDLSEDETEAVRFTDRGERAFESESYEEAERCFVRSIELEPKSVDSHNNLMVLCWHLDRPAEAIDYLAKALEIDPGNRSVVVNGAQILAAFEQTEEARQLLLAYGVQHPEDSEIAELIASFTGKTGEKIIPVEEKEVSIAENTSVTVVDYSKPENVASAPRISVVIPSFNQGKYLEETLISVISQGYPNLELIVMDGGSTDNSVSVIKKYEQNISYWQSEKDSGQYWAIDAGFKRTDGEIMTWINSDDKLHANCLNTIASIFTRRSEVQWVTGTPNMMGEDGLITCIHPSPPVFSQEKYLQKNYDFPTFIQQEGTFWTREVWHEAGSSLNTTLAMAGDLELWTRFFRHASLYTLDVLTGCFRQQRNQKTALAMDEYRAEAEAVLDAEIERQALHNLPTRKHVPPISIVRNYRPSGYSSMLVCSVKKILGRPKISLKTHSRIPLINEDKALVSRMHAAEPLVTAIVSTYNSEKYLRGCLDDLQQQTIADRLEIIVVDSGSEQNESAIVEEYQARYSNIRYIRSEERETIYSAWNRGATKARGRYLSNANTDDRHRPDAYERMVEVLEENADTALVYADSAVTRQANTGFTEAEIVAYFKWPEFNARDLFSVCYVGPQPMWRRSLHEKYGYFDARMRVAGDYDFWLRLAGTERFKHIPEVLGLYLQADDSIEHAFAGAGAQESEQARQKNWIEEWGERPELHPGYLVPVSQINTNEKVLVSIVVATKNRPHLLAGALRSLEQQSYSNWEAIIVNDGGEDVSDIVSQVDTNLRMHYMNNTECMGQAQARNRAFQEAKGDIICILDDDDLFLSNHLSTVVEALNNPERDFVYTDADIVQETFKNEIRNEIKRSKPYRHGSYSKEDLFIDNYIPINTWAFRRDCLQQHGGFDTSLSCCEDWEFLLRLSLHYEFVHVDTTTVEVHHRVDAIDNVTRQRLAETVSVYESLYARYGQIDNERVQLGRKNSIIQLHQKLDRQEAGKLVELQVEGAASSDAGSSVGKSRLEMQAERFLRRASELQYHCPSVHLFTIVEASELDSVITTIESLSRQIYTGWGLTILSTLEVPSREIEQIPMIEWVTVDDPHSALNVALNESQGEWLSIIDTGHELVESALSSLVDYSNKNKHWELIYTDEISAEAKPLYKPDINIDYLYGTSYIGSLVFFTNQAWKDINGSTRSSGAINYDVTLKLLEKWGKESIGHIADLLIKAIPNESSENRSSKNVIEHRESLVEHLARTGSKAIVVDGLNPGTRLVDYSLTEFTTVEVVLFAGDQIEHSAHSIRSLLEKTGYQQYNVRIGVISAYASSFQSIDAERLSIDIIDDKTNRAEYINACAKNSSSDYLLILEPGCMVLQENWLVRMLGQAQRDEIGVVGVRLINTDKKVVHGGILAGIGSFGVGAIALEGLSLDDPGYMQRAQVAQIMSAVSSACLLCNTQRFVKVGGFDNSLDVLLYQDVDFCQKVRNLGKEVLWTPLVTMLFSGNSLGHYHGKKSLDAVQLEARSVMTRWLKSFANDPTYNHHLGLKTNEYTQDKKFAPTWNPELHELPGIIGCGVGSYGSWQYRVAQPINAMSREGVANIMHIPFANRERILLPTSVEIERLRPDAMLMHNVLHDDYISALAGYKKHNDTFIVFGQDDLMSALPPKNPYFKTVYKDIKKRVRKCASLADRIIVTTDSLANELHNLHDDIQVVPNYLDENIWGALQSKRNTGARPRVGWAGAQQHYGDLEILQDVVRETANEVDWIFFGMCPDFLKPYVHEEHSAVNFADYPEKLASLNLDLAVAPLERNKFNQGKSNLRLLEYGMLGWPVIATDIDPYKGAPVCRVTNQSKAWINAIRERVADMDATRREGDQLQRWVRENYILQRNFDTWLTALDPSRTIAGLEIGQTKVAGLYSR